MGQAFEYHVKVPYDERSFKKMMTTMGYGWFGTALSHPERDILKHLHFDTFMQVADYVIGPLVQGLAFSTGKNWQQIIRTFNKVRSHWFEQCETRSVSLNKAMLDSIGMNDTQTPYGIWHVELGTLQAGKGAAFTPPAGGQAGGGGGGKASNPNGWGAPNPPGQGAKARKRASQGAAWQSGGAPPAKQTKNKGGKGGQTLALVPWQPQGGKPAKGGKPTGKGGKGGKPTTGKGSGVPAAFSGKLIHCSHGRICFDHHLHAACPRGGACWDCHQCCPEPGCT